MRRLVSMAIASSVLEYLAHQEVVKISLLERWC